MAKKRSRGCPKAPMILAAQQREELQRWAARRKTAQGLAKRASIILACAEGRPTWRWPGTWNNHPDGGRWRQRFLDHGTDGLLDEPRPGAPRRVGDDDVERVVRMTLETAPTNATHWSTRDMAKASGLSQSSISRIWRAFSLQPHRRKASALQGPAVRREGARHRGLYMNPPTRPWCFVWTRSPDPSPGSDTTLLPMRPGQIERRTHDYVRHGTSTLFAALDIASGKVIGKLHRRHRAVEFRRFLDTIDAEVQDCFDVHSSWTTMEPTRPRSSEMARHRPRFHVHFTPRRLVAQHGRAMVRYPHRQEDQAGQLPQHLRTGDRNQKLPAENNQNPNPSCDQDGQSDSPVGGSLLPPNYYGLRTQDTSMDPEFWISI